MRMIAILLIGFVGAAQAAELKPGQASGTYKQNYTTVSIGHAAIFSDQEDARKPVVLILSNVEIKTAGWKGDSDFMKYRMHNPFLGVAFWLDEDRHVLRSAYFDENGYPYGENNLFELKLDPGDKTSLKGIAESTVAAARLAKPVDLDVTFNASAGPAANGRE